MAVLCTHCGAEHAAGVNIACRDCRLAPGNGTAWSLPDLENGPDEVDFDLADWTPADRVALAVTLDERVVPWRWEAGPVLVVQASDEEVVDSLLDEMEEQEDGEGGDDEGDAWGEAGDEEWDEEAGEEAAAAMGNLFDVGDRLMHNPDNAELLLEVDRLASVVEGSAPPFGVEQSTWEEIGRLAAAVVEASDDASEEDGDEDGGEQDGGEDDDESGGKSGGGDVAAAARALRDYLRDFV